MAQRVRTIFLVVGAAHGGTSIAVMLLGQHPDVFATGELTGFPDGQHFLDDNICGCGEPAKQCEFWSLVCNDCSAKAGSGSTPILDVYRSIFRRSQAAAIVDCAHDGARAFELSELTKKEPDLKLVIVSVVRPVESVASSQLRVALERNRIKDKAWPRLKRVSKAAVRRQKILREVQPENLNCKVVIVNYATLCDRPLDVLRPIWEEAEVESMSAAQWLGGGSRSVHKPTHMIRGNRKLRSREKIELRRDLSASSLSGFEKLIVKAIANLPIERLVFAIKRIYRGLQQRSGESRQASI